MCCLKRVNHGVGGRGERRNIGLRGNDQLNANYAGHKKDSITRRRGKDHLFNGGRCTSKLRYRGKF